jgi:hypothetical protein
MLGVDILKIGFVGVGRVGLVSLRVSHVQAVVASGFVAVIMVLGG